MDILSGHPYAILRARSFGKFSNLSKYYLPIIYSVPEYRVTGSGREMVLYMCGNSNISRIMERRLIPKYILIIVNREQPFCIMLRKSFKKEKQSFDVR